MAFIIDMIVGGLCIVIGILDMKDRKIDQGFTYIILGNILINTAQIKKKQ